MYIIPYNENWLDLPQLVKNGKVKLTGSALIQACRAKLTKKRNSESSFYRTSP